MHTLYASGQIICVQKFRIVYQRKELEKRMLHFKSTFQIQWNKCSLQTMHAFPSHTRVCSVIVFNMFCLRCWDRVPFFAYAVCIAVCAVCAVCMIFMHTIQYTQKFALTWSLHITIRPYLVAEVYFTQTPEALSSTIPVLKCYQLMFSALRGTGTWDFDPERYDKHPWRFHDVGMSGYVPETWIDLFVWPRLWGSVSLLYSILFTRAKDKNYCTGTR